MVFVRIVVISACQLLLFSHHGEPHPTGLAEDQLETEKNTVVKQKFDYLPTYNPHGYLRLWPNGIIPYEYDKELKEDIKSIFEGAIKSYKKKTCIRWVPAQPSHEHKVIVFHGNGCYAALGRSPLGLMGNGKQYLSLQAQGCGYHHVAVHEMMHTIGFGHEQNRWDRDQYVRVIVENIQPTMMYNFDKAPKPAIRGWGPYPYEYNSVMHYGPKGFGIKPNLETMESLNGEAFGANDAGLTDMDVEQIKSLYKCDEAGGGGGSGGGGSGGSGSGSGSGKRVGDKLLPPDSISDNFTLAINVLKKNNMEEHSFVSACLHIRGGIFLIVLTALLTTRWI